MSQLNLQLQEKNFQLKEINLKLSEKMEELQGEKANASNMSATVMKLQEKLETSNGEQERLKQE